MGGVWGYCGYVGCGRKSRSDDPEVNTCDWHDRGDGKCRDADAERRELLAVGSEAAHRARKAADREQAS